MSARGVPACFVTLSGLPGERCDYQLGAGHLLHKHCSISTAANAVYILSNGTVLCLYQPLRAHAGLAR